MNTSSADYPIHELIAKRFSPRSFADTPVAAGELASLFEAARWAPSSFNEQPWRFLVATREEPAEFEKLLSVLVPRNQSWARNAPVLALGIAKRSFTRNGRENRSALHDLGQATANLTLEATARGLYVHQMAGIDLDRARELYQVPEDFAVVTAFAIGYLGHESAPAQRSRKPLNDLVFTKSFGTAAGF